MNRKVLTIAVCLIGGIILLAVFLKGAKRHESNQDQTSAQSGSVQKLYAEAKQLRENGDWLKAKEIYQKIMSDYPDFDQMPGVQQELGDLNMQILLSNVQTPKTTIYEVVSGDSLGKIGSKFHTTIDFLKRSNNLSSSVIRAGQKLRIYNAQFNIYVDKSQNILILKDNAEVVKVYHVSTGKNNSTPVGKYKIVSKLVDPVWFAKGVVVPPESPANVLGSRWMRFDLPGYGIHGTIDPQQIGQQVTAGCVRMRNEEVEEIYSIIPLGTEVTIVD